MSEENDDTVEEHLDNPIGIKEILGCATRMASLKPMTLVGYLQKELATFHFLNPAAESKDEERLSELCWLLHALRIYYA